MGATAYYVFRPYFNALRRQLMLFLRLWNRSYDFLRSYLKNNYYICATICGYICKPHFSQLIQNITT